MSNRQGESDLWGECEKVSKASKEPGARRVRVIECELIRLEPRTGLSFFNLLALAATYYLGMATPIV